jgi:hypothetical protein
VLLRELLTRERWPEFGAAGSHQPESVLANSCGPFSIAGPPTLARDEPSRAVLVQDATRTLDLAQAEAELLGLVAASGDVRPRARKARTGRVPSHSSLGFSHCPCPSRWPYRNLTGLTYNDELARRIFTDLDGYAGLIERRIAAMERTAGG